MYRNIELDGVVINIVLSVALFKNMLNEDILVEINPSCYFDKPFLNREYKTSYKSSIRILAKTSINLYI